MKLAEVLFAQQILRREFFFQQLWVGDRQRALFVVTAKGGWKTANHLELADRLPGDLVRLVDDDLNRDESWDVKVAGDAGELCGFVILWT